MKDIEKRIIDCLISQTSPKNHDDISLMFYIISNSIIPECSKLKDNGRN